MTLRLEIDPRTRERRILVKYESDADALPVEHEEAHRRVVEALVRSGRISPEQRALIVVEREAAPAAERQATPPALGAGEPAKEAAEPEPLAAGAGGAVAAGTPGRR